MALIGDIAGHRPHVDNTASYGNVLCEFFDNKNVSWKNAFLCILQSTETIEHLFKDTSLS